MSIIDMVPYIKSRKATIKLQCERDVAYESLDHLHPWGTIRDNSRNKRFNYKLNKLFGPIGEQITILDMGCSGGGFVRDSIEDGCFAVGIEGSDFSKRYKRAEWATIPEFLFTCDISGDFDMQLETESGSTRIQFDLVTSWDVMEHIEENKLRQVANNVKKHLKPHGLWVLSIDPNEDIVNGVNLHRTMHEKKWWIDTFGSFGLSNLEAYVTYFNTQFIRGPKYAAPDSFHLVLSANPAAAPPVPNENVKERIKDLWLGSKWQRELKSWVVGE